MTELVVATDASLAGERRSRNVEPTVRDEARRAFGWSLLNSVASRLTTVVIGLVLARLLVPEEYGLFAVGLLVLTILQSMNELGVSVAVVQWAGDVRRAARTATTLAVGTSGLLYAVVYLAAPGIAAFVGAPEAAPLIRILGVGVVIDGVSSIPGAMMARSFQQGRRAAADLVSIIPSSVVSITLAATGHGAVSLAWGALAGSATATVLVVLLAPARPLPGWRRDDARALLRTGAPLAGTSLVLLATLNLDYVIVGHTLDTTALGCYLLAFNLSSWPSNLLSVAARRVAIPAFARLAAQPAELQRAFVDSLRAVTALGWGLAVPLAMLASRLVDVVYGPRWHAAAAALTFLALLGGLRIVFDLVYDLLAAVGRSGSLLVVQIVWFGGLVVALPVGASLAGIEGVGAAHLIVACGVAGPSYGWALHCAGISIRASIVGLAPVALTAFGCAACVVLGGRLGLGGLPALLLLGATSVGAYVLMLAVQPTTRPIMAIPVAGLIGRMSAALRGRSAARAESLAPADESLKVLASQGPV